jgi:hypothetical protein
MILPYILLGGDLVDLNSGLNYSFIVKRGNAYYDQYKYLKLILINLFKF